MSVRAQRVGAFPVASPSAFVVTRPRDTTSLSTREVALFSSVRSTEELFV